MDASDVSLTTDMDLAVVIMAGGLGTRFWPLSTDRFPKQFIQIFGGRSLLQMAHDRISDLLTPERILVLTNESLAGLVEEQLPEVPPENVIAEPMRRDTAAAVCLGAVICRQRFGNPVIATLTSDHVIKPTGLFQKTILSAARQTRETGALYTLGIRPDYPATAYGYLELGREIGEDDDLTHFKIISFKEKPDLPTARQYQESGRYLWNSGMFFWTVEAIMAEMEEHLPGHATELSRAAQEDRTPGWAAALRKAFTPLKKISIDYAVMEKARDVRCVAAGFSWRDVGGWEALREHLPSDEQGNLTRGQVEFLDSSGNLVYCEDEGETVLLVGARDMIVVRSGQNTLIADRSRAEEVKMLVERLYNKK